MSRFDYVKYDEEAILAQKVAKYNVTQVETVIEQSLVSPRAKQKALDKLEECYMWIGKAIRDDQIVRGGSAEDVPERTNI